MTPLRHRMIEVMQLRGFSVRTRERYVAAVRQLAGHFHKSLDLLTEDDLRAYFLSVAKEKRVAHATATIAIHGIRFFFEQTLHYQWPNLRFVRPPREKKLPAILSCKEVRRILGEVRIPVYRARLTTIYACGLGCSKGRIFGCPTLTAVGCSCTSTAKGKKTATCLCPIQLFKCCVPTGKPIVRRSCFARLPSVTA